MNKTTGDIFLSRVARRSTSVVFRRVGVHPQNVGEELVWDISHVVTGGKSSEERKTQ